MLIQILAACTAQPVVNNYYEYNTYTQAAPTDTGTSDHDSAGDDSATTDTAPDTSSDETATDTAAEEPSLADRVCASSILNEFAYEVDPYTAIWPDDYADWMYCYGQSSAWADPWNGSFSSSGIYSVAPNGCSFVTSVDSTPCPAGECISLYQTTNSKTSFTLMVSAERVTFDLCDARSTEFEIVGYRVKDGTNEFTQAIVLVSPGEGFAELSRLTSKNR